MRRTFLCHRYEADRAIEAGRFRGIGPQADDKKVILRTGKQALHKDACYATTASAPQHIDMSQATDVIALGVRVAIDASDTDEHTILVDAKQRFTGTIKAVGTVQPIRVKTVEELKALLAGLFKEGIEASGLGGD